MYSWVKQLVCVALWRLEPCASFLPPSTVFPNVRRHLILFVRIKTFAPIFPPERLHSFCLLSWFPSLIFIDDKNHITRYSHAKNPDNGFAWLYFATTFRFDAQVPWSASLLLDFPSPFLVPLCPPLISLLSGRSGISGSILFYLWSPSNYFFSISCGVLATRLSCNS